MEIVSTEKFDSGIMRKCIAFDFNGHKYMLKGGTHSEILNEFIAYKLALKLGVGCNKVFVLKNNRWLPKHFRWVSAHKWIDELEVGQETWIGLKKMRLFDWITDNDDRHDSNFGVAKGKFVLIDHAYCCMRNQNVEMFYGNTQYAAVQKVIKKFVAINPDGFVKMFRSVPSDFKKSMGKDYNEYVSSFVNRMILCQSMLRKGEDHV